MPQPESPSQPNAGDLRIVKDRYLTWMAASGYSQFSLEEFERDLLRLFDFLEGRGIARLADVTSDSLRDYCAWLKKHRECDERTSAKYLQRHTIALKSFFRWAAGQMILFHNPFEWAGPLSQAQTETFLTPAEAMRILDACDMRGPIGVRDRAVLEVLYYTGVRKCELLKLKVGDVDLAARALIVRGGKLRRDRVLALPISTVDVLREYIENARPLFAQNMTKADAGFLYINQTGSALNDDGIRYTFMRALRAAGIGKPVTATTFRCTIGEHLMSRGLSAGEVQRLLGSGQRPAPPQEDGAVTLSSLQEAYLAAHPEEGANQSDQV